MASKTVMEKTERDKPQVERYDGLSRVSRAISAYREPDELFRALAEEIRQAADFDFLSVLLYDEASQDFRIQLLETRHGRGITAPRDLARDETIAWWIYQNQKPVVIPSIRDETRFPRVMAIYSDNGIQAACLVPLTTSRRRLGAIGFGTSQKHIFTEGEVEYLGLVADQVALAVDNALRDHEQRHSEEELRKQEAHFEELFELAPEAIVIRDFHNRVLRVNEEFTRLFGYAAEEAVGRKINELIVPDGLWEESERLREAVARGERVSAELVRKRKDGSQVMVSFVAASVALNDSSPEVYVIYRDITRQKEAEEALKMSEARLAEAQRLSHMGSWARSVSTGEVSFSQEAFRIFGFDAASTKVTLELILGRVHPEDRPGLQNELRNATREARGFDTNYRIILDDGSIRHVHSIGRAVKNPSGAAIEYVGTIMDVTEQYRSRKALEDALAEIRGLKDQLLQENVALRQEIDEASMFDDIVGKSAALQKVLKEVETVGPTESTVLIHGETGTGKELIARAIHNRSARAERAFVKVNCAAIPTGLLESEVFGHEKGAFTGAIAQRIGRFELANHGTVFLDEIGEIPLELQPKLLRVLQEREFERLGSSRTLRTDARLIVATNRDLSTMVSENKFRSDLFYRLNVFPIHVPALRERPEDIPLLVRYFAELFSRRMSKPIETIPAETMSALMRYGWPGNIRELQNVIERAVILSSGGVLNVPAADLKSNGSPGASAKIPKPAASRIPRTNARTPSREDVLQALKDAGGRVGGTAGAAARLGLKRTTLIAHIKRLGLHVRSANETA